MRKKSILGLIILMSLSLIGIIGAQYLWISQSMKVQREKFYAAVYASLDNSVRRIENEANAQTIYQSFVPSFNYPKPKIRIDTAKVNRLKRNANQLIHQVDTLTSNGTRIQTRISIDGNSTEKQVWITSNGEHINIVELEQQMKLMEDSISKSIHIFDENEDEMMRVFNQMHMELKTRHDPVKQRLNMANFHKVIGEELKQQGIKTKFQYGVINGLTKKVTEFQSDNFVLTKAMEQNGVRVSLFPRDIFRSVSPYDLVVYFPDVDTYLYKSQGWMLGLSSFFTVFILITFYLTIKMILDQKKVSQVKTDFINNMTHEFKTPIATINLATDSILTPTILADESKMKTFLRIIKEENNRMNSHVERVLQMAQIEKKDFSVVKISMDVHELIERAVDSMQLLVNETRGHISLALDAELAVFSVDEVHFGNLVVNLLENALKYSENPPVVTISTANTSNGLCITIKDEGIGMTKEQQNKIFEKFYRAKGGNVHDVKGFGLGLSYVKAVVDAHNGSISVKSKPQQGTEFSITLPFN